MPQPKEDRARCLHCGHIHSAPVDACAGCGEPMDDSSRPAAAQHADWSLARDSIKTRWVASVIAFWVSAAILVVVSLIEGRLNLILVSVCLGLLLIGVWLKTRYQLHLRREPGRR